MALYSRVIGLPDDFQDEDYLLTLAYIHAYETLEYPLYAVWGPFLMKYARPSPNIRNIVVVTYVQAPVDRNFRQDEDIITDVIRKWVTPQIGCVFILLLFRCRARWRTCSA